MTGLLLKRDDAAGDGFARAWSATSARGFRIVVVSDSPRLFFWDVELPDADRGERSSAQGSAPSLRVAARCARAVVRALERGA